MPFAIETVQLTRRFGARLALDAVSLQVPEACVYGFLGRNGAGKTTLIKLLLGLLRADAGQVLIRGVDVARDRLAAATQTGALLEAQGFYDHLSGRENLDLSRRLLGLPKGEIDRVLDLCEMREHGPRRVADYSLGMRQRLGLARAMLGAPPVLILDEPTNGLDPEGIADMRVFLRELPARCGATVLLSSHLLSEIEQTASHVGILSQGRLVRQGRLADLKASVQGEVLIGTDMPERALAVAQAHGFDVCPGDGGVLARIPAGEAIAAVSAALNRVLCVAGVRVHALTPRQHSLESLYREAGSAHASPTPSVPPLAA
jgi:lantibiotic transport system ATP-binding protein